MINIQTEEVLSLTEAARRLPRRRAGKRPHVATLYRWAQHGVRGEKLETIQVGGTLCTSLAALQRLFDRLSGEQRVQVRSTRTRKREIERAERELERVGISQPKEGIENET